MADIIIITALAVLVFFIVRSQLRKLRKGQCGGGCAGCCGSCGGGCGTPVDQADE
ncbi:MAG: FeoB-associated Cys-rich membrane protein [Acetatifactor sp.]|nr:FeoB-associated Cys-rich membrane protein [Acetatifactor sp.]MDE7044890.1 FeoB-associated Cys-rich membrane protein [Acetatifactor sp.]